MKKVNGFTYSTKKYDGYKFRAIIEYVGFALKHSPQRLEVYTDNPSRNEVEKLILNAISKKLDTLNRAASKIVHWCTVEQDEINAALIDELFAEWDKKDAENESESE